MLWSAEFDKQTFCDLDTHISHPNNICIAFLQRYGLCADLRNVCTEAGMFAIRDERDYVVQEDFMKAVRKMNDAKKLETTISYDSSFGEGKG